MGIAEMQTISELINAVLKRVKVISDSQYEIDESFRDEIAGKVKQLCSRFPLH
jgi:glycine/serine hydroxymethyltransferase